MLFNSLDFAIFLPIVFILYWFVAQNNIKLTGSFNPELLNLSDDNFYDGMHIKEETRNNLMKQNSVE